MFLKKIKVERFGGRKSYEAEFHAPLCILKGREQMPLWLAPMCVLLGHDVLRFQTTRYCMCPDTHFSAEIEEGGKTYAAEAAYSEDARDHCLVRVFHGGKELSEQERRAIFHVSAEEELCSVFFNRYDMERWVGERVDFTDKIAAYRALAQQGDAALAERTDGISLTPVFQNALTAFCKTFVPESFSVAKQIVFTMGEDGVFLTKTNRTSRLDLSACEDLLQQYKSFLAVNRFWDMVQKNTNRVHEKPLFIGNFTEGIDEAVDLAPLLRQALSLGRQVFLFTWEDNIGMRLRSESDMQIVSPQEGGTRWA